MLGDLALKARMTTEKLNEVKDVRCNELMGAMYAFPRIFLPEKAVADAKVRKDATNSLSANSSKTVKATSFKFVSVPIKQRHSHAGGYSIYLPQRDGRLN